MLKGLWDFLGLTSPPKKAMREVNQDLLSVLDAGDEADGATAVSIDVDGTTQTSSAAALYGD